MRRLFAPLLFLFAILHGPTYEEVVEQAERSVVKVSYEQAALSDSGPIHHYCTGFVIAQDRVVTAAHCLGGHIVIDGDPDTFVLRFDGYLDVALLAVREHKRPLVVRDTDAKALEALTGIGYAQGWVSLTVVPTHVIQPSMPLGIGSHIPPGVVVKPGYIPGMSGGPVIDGNGYVVSLIQRNEDDTGYGLGAIDLRMFLAAQ